MATKPDAGYVCVEVGDVVVTDGTIHCFYAWKPLEEMQHDWNNGQGILKFMCVVLDCTAESGVTSSHLVCAMLRPWEPLTPTELRSIGIPGS